MKQFFYSVFCIVALAACKGNYKKGDGGLEYKIFSEGNGKKLNYGNFIQLHVKQVYSGTKDTTISDTRDFMAPIQVFDSVNTPLAYFKILKQLNSGDSAIIRVLTDSAFKGAPQGMPPYMKKGKHIYYYIKLLNIFETAEQADSVSKKERELAKPRIFKKQMEMVEKEISANKQQLDKDDKIISAYLAKNNIKAEKTKWGTYITVTTEGTGSMIDHNSIAKVKYTGKTLDSNYVFDSNMEPGEAPYSVTVASLGEVIFGWTDALLHMKKGTKATVYIPSSLAYGTRGRDRIKPDDILVFDMEITDVMTEAEYTAIQQQEQQKMMEAEQKRVDSIQKAYDKKNNKK
jgi:FKBP-type peptidyl-prolyl cis-trans isomerase FkpA